MSVAPRHEAGARRRRASPLTTAIRCRRRASIAPALAAAALPPATRASPAAAPSRDDWHGGCGVAGVAEADRSGGGNALHAAIATDLLDVLAAAIVAVCRVVLAKAAALQAVERVREAAVRTASAASLVCLTIAEETGAAGEAARDRGAFCVCMCVCVSVCVCVEGKKGEREEIEEKEKTTKKWSANFSFPFQPHKEHKRAKASATAELFTVVLVPSILLHSIAPSK